MTIQLQDGQALDNQPVSDRDVLLTLHAIQKELELQTLMMQEAFGLEVTKEDLLCQQ
jgi:hypothetical protein